MNVGKELLSRTKCNRGILRHKMGDGYYDQNTHTHTHSVCKSVSVHLSASVCVYKWNGQKLYIKIHMHII